MQLKPEICLLFRGQVWFKVFIL